MLFHALLALAAASSPGSDSVARDSSVTPARNEASAPARRHTTFGVAIAPVPESVRALPYLEADEGVVLAQVQPRLSGRGSGPARRRSRVERRQQARVDETTIFSAVRSAPRNKPFRVEYLRNGGWREAWVTIDQ